MRISGIGAVVNHITVPPDQGVSYEAGARACAIAGGTWNGTACVVPDPQAPPDWCGPFGYLAFDSCKQFTESELAMIGAYTRYKVAQVNEQAAIDARAEAIRQAKLLAPTQTQDEVMRGLPGTIVGSTANLLGSAAGDVGKGLFGSLDMSGLLILAGGGFLAYKVLTR